MSENLNTAIYLGKSTSSQYDYSEMVQLTIDAVQEILREQLGTHFASAIEIEDIKNRILTKKKGVNSLESTKSKHTIPDRFRTIETSPELFEKASTKFKDFFCEVDNHILESTHIINSLSKALLTREHMLLVGAAGNAKSMIPAYTLARITDEETSRNSYFSYAMQNMTTVDDLLGPIRWDLFKKDGRYERDLDKGILGYNYAYLDEVFDCHPDVLRSILNALNERVYRQGAEEREGVLETSFQTTNRYVNEIRRTNRSKDYNPMDAYFDRMLFISLVPEYFINDSSYYKMVEENVLLRKKNKIHGLEAELTCGDIDILQTMVGNVEVDREVIEFYTMFMKELDNALKSELNNQNTKIIRTKQFSKRTFNKDCKVIQANVIFDKIFNNRQRSLKATINDIAHLADTLILNAPEQEKLNYLIKNNLWGSEREKVQLDIAIKEREIFDKVLGETKNNYPKAIQMESEKIELPLLQKNKTELPSFTQTTQLIGHFHKLISAESSAQYQKNIIQIAQVKEDTIKSIGNFIDKFHLHDFNMLTDVPARLKICSDIKTMWESHIALDNQNVNISGVKKFFIDTADLLNTEILEITTDSVKKKNAKNNLEKCIKEWSNAYAVLESNGTIFEDQSSWKMSSLNTGKSQLVEIVFTFLSVIIEQCVVGNKDRLEELFVQLNAQVNDPLFADMKDKLNEKVDDHLCEQFQQGTVSRLLKISEIKSQLLDIVEGAGYTIPKTLLSLRDAIAKLVIAELSANDDVMDLKYLPEKPNKNLENYTKFDMKERKYLEKLNLKEYQALEKRIQKHFEKNDLLTSRYLPELASYESGEVESSNLSKKIFFLNEWISEIQLSIQKTLTSATSFKDINSATELLQSSGIFTLIQQKELFRLKQMLEIFAQKSITKSNTVLELRAELTHIESKYNSILNDINAASQRIIAKDFSISDK